MGGVGSGTWYRYDKKTTVEDSLTLSIWDFRDEIYSQSSGTLKWIFAGGRESSIAYSVSQIDCPVITLRYCWSDREDIEISLRLQSTPTNFNGRRWWFTCPLVSNGVACQRRVGKVYLPPGSPYFGCRNCHDLTYRSSQEAHQVEWFPGERDCFSRSNSSVFICD